MNAANVHASRGFPADRRVSQFKRVREAVTSHIVRQVIMVVRGVADFAGIPKELAMVSDIPVRRCRAIRIGQRTL